MFTACAAALVIFGSSLARGEPASGPTIELRYGSAAPPNPVANFMYFVPLISPQPVMSVTSSNCTQAVRVLSSKRHVSGHAFTFTCEMQLEGSGWQQSIFDVQANIDRHREKLLHGDSIDHQLKSIDVRGDGRITVEVKGAITNGAQTVNEVRMHFNSHGQASPVWIGLCDIRNYGGEFRQTNEMVARVNALGFKRKPGPPHMEVSVASVKHKDAGDGFWANLKGGLAGVAVNLFIPPLRVEAIGNEAMLNFGQALINGSASFTFPRARNLRKSIASIPHPWSPSQP